MDRWERETSAGGGNVCWEDRLSLDGVLWDIEERLGAVEMEAQGGTFALQDVQSSSKVLWGAHQGAVVQVPHVEAEI